VIPRGPEDRKAGSAAARKNIARIRSGGRRASLLLRTMALVAVVAVIVLVIVAVRKWGHSEQQPMPPELNSPPATSAVGRKIAPPWRAPLDAAAAARAAGLPLLSHEGTVEHIHAHLDVRVDGQAVEVPRYIGIDASGRGISPVHTHDPTGIIHIESPVKRAFTLGEFFTEWDVSLSPNNIGGLTVGDGKTLRVFVNGIPATGNPAALIINAHDEIALVYGSPGPGESIPAHYDFPPGL
jgi:hypothetical protein